MTVRPSPDMPSGLAEREAVIARREAELERRESAVTRSEQAQAGMAEGVTPAAPPVDEQDWWARQLGHPLEAA